MAKLKGNRLMLTGGVILAVGMLLTLVAVLPLFIDLQLPWYWWALSMLTGLGLLLILLGLRRSSKTRSSL
jgi:membrane protein implicated in regulation of membrane protease activity